MDQSLHDHRRLDFTSVFLFLLYSAGTVLQSLQHVETCADNAQDGGEGLQESPSVLMLLDGQTAVRQSHTLLSLW